MDAVDYNCHQVMQLERYSAYSIANGDIRYLLHVSSDLFEEKVALLSWDFW